MGNDIAYIELGTIYGLRQPLWVLEPAPEDTGGLLYRQKEREEEMNSPKVNSPSSYAFCPFVQICRSVSAYRPGHPHTEWKALGDPNKG